MGSVVLRLLMFVSAYFPLALIFFALYFNTHRKIAVSILLVGIIGLAGLRQYLITAQTLAPLRVKVESVQHREVEVIRNILAYLLPFVSIAFNDLLRAAALCLFVLVVGILYVRSNLIHMNPALSLAGFRVYDVKIEGAGTHTLLSRSRIGRGDSLLVIKIGDNLFLEKQK